MSRLHPEANALAPARAPVHVPVPSVLRAPPHILIACMPKSGSTFLTNIIAALPGFRRAELVPDFGHREQELDEPCLRGADRFAYVAQNHVRNSQWTADMCREYGLTKIILVRSLLDVVVSIRDHLRRESAVWPIFFAEPHHAAMDDARLEEMIVRLALPWYLNFYMGWRRAPDTLLVEYEDLAQRPAATAARVLAFAGVAVSAADIQAAVAEASGSHSRLNVGVKGRGARLRPRTLHALLELLDFYPEAATDPYVCAVRAQAQAALWGGSQPPPVRPEPPPQARRRFAALRRWWARNGSRLVIRIAAPVALTGIAVGYWLWPVDLLPDSAAFGRVDDVVCLIAFGVVAGRLTKYKSRAAFLERRMGR